LRLASIRGGAEERAAVCLPGGVVPVEEINSRFETSWPAALYPLLWEGLTGFRSWFEASVDEGELAGMVLPYERVAYAPPYRTPPKIWGIGLNYVEHAEDLKERAPSDEPASFMKPPTTIIGPGDAIRLPPQSSRVTAEAELGLVIGRECRNVSEEDALSCLAGYVPVIDMTAEDILERNPRYLTRSKSFDTFFSFGPQLVTPDEVEDLEGLEVATVVNGEVHRRNVVSNMTFSPEFLVSFHSRVMTLLPGDIISPGTPGAVVIREGDVVRCEVRGFETLENPVERQD
jgi:2-keto-4-pentenoate hydratase/2-oxohepta-3-ene-1,7-dioic acid hydratase in catechol pathway